MLQLLGSTSFLPSCILAGVGLMFVVLVVALPAAHALALIAGTAVAAGLVVARLRRETAASRPVEHRVRAKA
ncbi:hypothetical protein GCM10009416_43940 [Craurococcus roseus]|uniref:Uncharacterized protein n=1 Tax=Craurococcus roseus TaxID=77585 RepID=A0ABP3R4M0_9PROT